MHRPAHPQRVSDLVERLQRYFDEDGASIVVTPRLMGSQGLYISVSLPDNLKNGLVFHADQLDNGASGFKAEALERIRAFIAQERYEPKPVNPKLVYDDVMAMGGEDAPLEITNG